MATRARAREIFDRSRVMLGRSAVAAAHLLDPDRHPPLRAVDGPPARPAPPVIEAASAAPAPTPAAPAVPVQDDSLVDVCASIALRDLNLIDTLLSDLELMERHEDDSNRLDQLYRLDHLAARLRRNAENLRVLANHDADEDAGETISILDTVRAAMSSIDQYAKVGIGRMAPLGVVGFAANDLSRVVTELLDNAANHSPPNADVRVSSHLTEQGSVLIRIEDDGIGLPPERLAELNDRLSRESRLDDAAVRHMGLAVVRRLAERHGLQIALDHRLPNGTTATILVPSSLVIDVPDTTWTGAQTVPVRGRHHRGQPEVNGVAPDFVASGVEAPAALPHRGAAPSQRAALDPAPRPAPAPWPSPPPSPAVAGTTDTGLPRRVSRSIKPGAGVAAPTEFTSDSDGQDAFLADLDSFTDGEKAANAEDAPAEGGEVTDGDLTLGDPTDPYVTDGAASIGDAEGGVAADEDAR
ncbi:ATP-binding protein [Pseudonocardia sp. RS11V-5]|uniref:sensor histidine kinase n=1 Tax=Pseudonocardia terrae TaxID=2905831 RepID=UPI001E3CF1D9|nr:ATP-binding protein [Pseudonocardia terrae]MCE3554718.1 ATP-binding protein [Pseudonocardia terrae]